MITLLLIGVCIIALLFAAYLIAAGLLRLLANCDERDDTYSDPDPKPVRRRAF